VASASFTQNWQNLNQRERTMVLAIALALAATLLWFMLAPAIKTWQKVPAERAKLEKELAAVQALGVQAQVLKNAPSLSFDAAYLALGKTTAQYLPPSTHSQVLGEQVTVQLQAVPAHTLAQWLAAVRNNAKALPVSSDLKVVSMAADGSGAVWSGTVVLQLPSRG
jgi:general secretion pathway protein M